MSPSNPNTLLSDEDARWEKLVDKAMDCRARAKTTRKWGNQGNKKIETRLRTWSRGEEVKKNP